MPVFAPPNEKPVEAVEVGPPPNENPVVVLEAAGAPKENPEAVVAVGAPNEKPVAAVVFGWVPKPPEKQEYLYVRRHAKPWITFLVRSFTFHEMEG